MGRFSSRILGTVGATMAVGAVFGGGVAGADALAGMTYDDAAARISGWSGEAVIGTVSGNQLPTGECVVTSWQQSRFLDTSGRNGRQNEFVLNLNCNNRLAKPGHPGNSLMSPEGASAKKDQQSAASISKNPAFCEQSDEYMKWCKGICERTGLCEI